MHRTLLSDHARSALANLLNLLNPALVIIGGGLARLGETLLATGGVLSEVEQWSGAVVSAVLATFAGTIAMWWLSRRPGLQFPRQSFELPYIAALVFGAGIGAYIFGTLNLWFSGMSGIARSVEGALAGQFHYADLLPTEALGRLEKSGGKAVPLLTPYVREISGLAIRPVRTKLSQLVVSQVSRVVQIPLFQAAFLVPFAPETWGYQQNAIRHAPGTGRVPMVGDPGLALQRGKGGTLPADDALERELATLAGAEKAPR